MIRAEDFTYTVHKHIRGLVRRSQNQDLHRFLLCNKRHNNLLNKMSGLSSAWRSEDELNIFAEILLHIEFIIIRKLGKIITQLFE